MTTTQANPPARAHGPICQSCSMPLTKPEDFGTELNGTRNDEYCAYCYTNGAFTAPNVTMEQMRDFCIVKMTELRLMTHAQADVLMRDAIPKLKRWTSEKKP